MGSLIKTQSHLKNRDWQNLDIRTHTPTQSQSLTLSLTHVRTHTITQSQAHTQSCSHTYTVYVSQALFLSLSLLHTYTHTHTHTHTHTKIPRRPAPATRAVYQVIIVWLQRFIICTDWVTTDGKGQAPLTRCSRNIFPHRPRVCPPSPLKGLIANAFVWGRGEETTRSNLPQVPLRQNINAAQSVLTTTHAPCTHAYEKNIHKGAVWGHIQSYLTTDTHQTHIQQLS